MNLNQARHAVRVRIRNLGLLALLAVGAVANGFPQTGPSPRSGVEPSQPLQVEGEVQILQEDFKDRGRVSYFLKMADGARIPLQFSKEPPTNLLTGDHIRASAQVSGGSLILASGSTGLTANTTLSSSATTTSSAPLPNTLGVQNALVILINFQDDAIQPYTVADAQNMFFGTASDTIKENSYGQTSITGSVVGWYTIPDSVATCNISQMATDAQNAAAAAGANLTAYTRYIYAFPENSSCGWAGSSYIGGTPSQSWINGSPLDPHTIVHELGHAFGLWHSHLLDCGTAATIGTSCTVTEYGDRLDTMGTPQSAYPDYNAFQKERLGWLGSGASPSIQTVDTSGNYTISPYEQGGAGPNALKVLKSTDPTTGAKTWYYLEARQAVGSDGFLAQPMYYSQNETTGVLFHIGTDGDGNTGDLLDMTPATPTSTGWYDASLVPGQSFQDTAAAVTFAPMAVSSSGATVQITISGQTCTLANPSVSLSPSQGTSVAAGTAVSFTVSVKDNDSSGCAPATFNLGDTLPSGWAGVWSSPALSLSPGTAGSPTLTVTSPAGTTSGAYTISLSAANAANATYAGSAASTYSISAPAAPTIGIATNQSSYLPGQTVAVTVTVLSGGSPSAGASVTITITPPSGKPTTLSGTTGTNGVASLSYKLSKRAAPGTYQVQVAISSTPGANSSLGASTSFTVQ